MHQTGTRHRRTQSASVSQARQPIEIVVTSPGSESRPLSPLEPPTRSNLFPPTAQNYRLLGRDHDRQYDSRAGGGGSGQIRLVVLVGLVLLTLVETLQYGRGRLVEYRAKERILHDEEEARRNVLRREIASTLFPSTTFYPRPLPEMSSPAESISLPSFHPIQGYLFPVRIAEQESKAAQHLHQLALLAISLNRTLVLPNVGGSRLHSCHLFPFAFHYDIETWVDRFEGKLSAISQEDWLEATGQREEGYTTRFINLMEGKKATLLSSEQKEDTGSPAGTRPDLANFCLAHASQAFKLEDPAYTTLYAPLRYREFDDSALAGFANGLVSSLSHFSPSVARISSTSASASASATASASAFIPNSEDIPSDVLLVDYNLRYPIFPSVLPNSTDLTPAEFETEETYDPVGAQVRNAALYDPWPALRSLATSPHGSSSPLSFLAFRPLPYANLWTELATSIMRRISPYAGVHWRMENVPSSHLSPCAVSLSRTLDTLSTEPEPPRTIYLASDYSFDSVVFSESTRAKPGSGSTTTRSLSDTFTDLTSSHRAAAVRLAHLLVPSSPSSILSLVFPASWFASHPPSLVRNRTVETLTTILDSSWSSSSSFSPSSSSESSSSSFAAGGGRPTTVLPPRLEHALARVDGDLFELDRGLHGILDKLVLARSTYFVAAWGADRAGHPHPAAASCGKPSSFTESIVSERRRRRTTTTTRREKDRHDDDDEDEMRFGTGRGGGEHEAESDKVGATTVGQIAEEKGDAEMDNDIVRWFRLPA